MTEKLLQYIWQFQYFNRTTLQTLTGDNIQILHPGQLNTNQGPDFLNARIQIGNTILAGSVELHLKTSGWNKHSHSLDKNYNNVVLHVVYQNDLPSFHLPVLELESRISQLMLHKYEQMMKSNEFLYCSTGIHEVKSIGLLSWKERLLAERLTRKAGYMVNILQETNQHWEELCRRMIARNFGGKINGDAFENIAKSISIQILAKHKQQIQQIEALLLGQADLLHSNFSEDYPQLLYREFNFLRQKYKLEKIVNPVQFLRMLPGGFPTVRLAQLASLVHTSTHLFSKIIEAEQVGEIRSLFQVTANDYWHYHYKLDEPSTFLPKKIGEDTIDNIVINTIVPLLFAYGLYHSNETYKIKALKWLESTKAEKNKITKGFETLQVKNLSAFDSQSLIELKNSYCLPKRCLECAIGVSLLKRSAV